MLDFRFTINNQRFTFRVGAIIVENDCVLYAKNELADYYYSIGGAVQMGETAQEAIIREVYEETGVHYEIDYLAAIHENFFVNSIEIMKGMECHEISLYFMMKPRGSQELHSDSTTLGVKEYMHWLPISELDQYQVYPNFIKDYLSSGKREVVHILTDDRK